MRLIGLAVVLTVGLALPPLAGEGQQQARTVPRIAILETASFTARDQTWSAFHQRLRDLGYAEGQSIVFERRSADGKTERLRGLAAELTALLVTLEACSLSPSVRLAGTRPQLRCPCG